MNIRAKRYEERYMKAHKAFIAAGNDDDYNTHAAAEYYALDGRRTLNATANLYELVGGTETAWI